MSKPKRKRNRGVILTPQGLERLKESRAAAERRENFGKRYTYEEIGELTRLDISTIKKVLNNREAVDKKTLAKLCLAFDLELVEELYTKPNFDQHQDWGEAVAVEHFCGRTSELKTLSQWLLQDGCRLIALLGMGGIGKTSLSIKLAQQAASKFECLVWKSLRDAPPVEDVVTYLIDFLSEGETAVNLPSRLGDRISRLIEYLRSRRCLILLDNAESLMDGGNRAGKYYQGYEGYGELIERIGATQHNSCLILTSREKPKEIAVLEGDRLPVRSLQLTGLKQGQKIIAVKGLCGSKSELSELSDRYDGNPLALKVVATTIKDLFAGNIKEFLRQEKAVFGDIRDLLDQQFARLSDLEQEIMYWLAIAREPISLIQLQSSFITRRTTTKLLEALESLSRRCLIDQNASSFTQQPVVMEYLTNRLVEGVSQEIVERQPKLLRNYALIEATAKDYVRENQIRLILQPVINELLTVLRSKQEIEQRLRQILLMLQATPTLEKCYGAGNIINLFCQLETDLTGYDFCDLCIWQADLRKAQLHQVNFQNSDLSKSVFAENFGGIWSVAFSPDGQYIAAGDSKGNILLRQVADGRPIRSFIGHNGWVVSLDFSPDGKTLASSSCDCRAKLWDVDTGQCIHTLAEHEQEVWSVAFSPDGKILATGCDDHKARFWHVVTGECTKVFQGHKNEVLSVAFTLDGQKLITASQDSSIRFWDIETEECLRVVKGHNDGVRSLSISADGKMIASSSNDRTIRLWNIKTGECLKVLRGHFNVILSVTFSPLGKIIASSSIGQKIRLWNIKTGECLKVLQGHSNMINSIAFAPQGDLLASGSNDQSIKLWSVSNFQCLKTWQGYSNQPLSVTFSPDGQTLVSGGHDEKVRLWNVKTGTIVKTFHDHTNWVFSVAFSPKHNFLASGSADRSVKLWNLNGEAIRTLWGHKAVIRSIAFSPDGQILASGSEDRTVWLWDVHSGKNLKVLQEHQAEIWSIVFNPDTQVLASASFDQTVKLWDISTGKCLKTLNGHESWVWSVTFSPDGQTLVSSSADQTIRFWDVNTGECSKILQDNIGNTQLVTFSSDGRIIASCNQDHNIRLLDVDTGTLLKTLNGHSALINSIVFSPDNSTLVSSSEDGTIRLWDLKTRKCLKILKSQNPYQEMNMKNITGLTQPTIDTLKILGAKS